GLRAFKRRQGSTNSLAETLRRRKEPGCSFGCRGCVNDAKPFQTLGDAESFPEVPEDHEAFPVERCRFLVVPAIESHSCQYVKRPGHPPFVAEFASQGEAFLAPRSRPRIITLGAGNESQTVDGRERSMPVSPLFT